jgi:hypothetical protein
MMEASGGNIVLLHMDSTARHEEEKYVLLQKI